MINLPQHTGTFTATSAAGAVFTVLVFTPIIVVGSQSGARRSRGRKTFQTSDGYAIDRREKGLYELPELGGLVVRSADPRAV
jgi:hypothetical protein